MTDSRVLLAKGQKSQWGLCDSELRTKVPEWMYDSVIRNSGGLDKSEVLRNWIGERLVGRLELVTGRKSVVRSSDATADVSLRVMEDSRDHLAALAILDGMTVEQYLQQIIERHLYGIHGPTIAGQQDMQKRHTGAR